MIREDLQSATVIPFNSFKEKIKLTQKYARYAKLTLIDNGYILFVWRDGYGERFFEQKDL